MEMIDQMLIDVYSNRDKMKGILAWVEKSQQSQQSTRAVRKKRVNWQINSHLIFTIR